MEWPENEWPHNSGTHRRQDNNKGVPSPKKDTVDFLKPILKRFVPLPPSKDRTYFHICVCSSSFGMVWDGSNQKNRCWRFPSSRRPPLIVKRMGSFCQKAPYLFFENGGLRNDAFSMEGEVSWDDRSGNQSLISTALPRCVAPISDMEFPVKHGPSN